MVSFVILHKISHKNSTQTIISEKPYVSYFFSAFAAFFAYFVLLHLLAIYELKGNAPRNAFLLIGSSARPYHSSSTSLPIVALVLLADRLWFRFATEPIGMETQGKLPSAHHLIRMGIALVAPPSC